MAQVLIRNLDQGVIDAYREAAVRNQRSLEAELRETLRLVQPISAPRKEELQRRFAELRAMTPNVVQTPAEVVVRELRDG